MTKTGFIEYTRTLPAARPPEERVFDWREFHEPMPESHLREQGARCMDCGVPFCHTGQIINGAASGCPINNLIPEWNDLVYGGRWREALDRLHQTNNFPEFTGRVCPGPCEGSCVLGINDAPVTIKSIEQAIIDKGFAAGWVEPKLPAVRTGKKVAVVGSGPAGLACASQLNHAGHLVTVFERADRAGGLLMYGIPNMKLEKAIVQRRLDLMSMEGIRFVTGLNVGQDYEVERLSKDFDAIVLCGGATRPRDLSLAGRNLRGIHFAMEFLHANTKSLLDSNHEDGHFLSARGRDVIVIGGGDTGTDCVGTALRHGCRSLAQFEILPPPPGQRAADNPWPQWPKVYRLDYGHEEAMAVFGRDPRAYSIMTKRFLGDEHGHLRGVQTVEVDFERAGNGHTRLSEVPGTERDWPAQMVLLALGFLGPETEGLLSQLGVLINERGNVEIDQDQMTSVPRVFAAGDMTRGQSLVVWAIADGRRAAKGVDRYLMGETVLP
ncbi:MAG: glutamate synthase small chain [Blastocatellia bacterium]|jgi:glutamate synthase (NADPH/NADH) small chain|nr:glutamate synthase small chain [Blastocatellia bacterium]